MLDRNKNKLKIEINKALQTVNNILKPTAEARQALELAHRELASDKPDRLHDTLVDTAVQQEFILSEYNRDARSGNYRSPYTNRYYPTSPEEASMPSPLLRDLEEKGNLLFGEYARLYYGEEGCISNFYVFESEEGLNFAFLLKKVYKDAHCYGVWCSTNIIEIRGDPAKSVSYKLQTAIVYELNQLNEDTGHLLQIYGSTKKNRVESKRWSAEYEMDEFHLLMTGRLVEEVETALRQQVESVFVAKTKDIIFKTRYPNSREDQNERKKRAKQITKMRSESNRVVD